MSHCILHFSVRNSDCDLIDQTSLRPDFNTKQFNKTGSIRLVRPNNSIQKAHSHARVHRWARVDFWQVRQADSRAPGAEALLFLTWVLVYYTHLSWDHSKSALFRVYPGTLRACSSTTDPVWMRLPGFPAWIVWLLCLLSLGFFFSVSVMSSVFLSECHLVFDIIVTSNFRGKSFTLFTLSSWTCPCLRAWKSVTLDGETSDVLTAEHKRESRSLKLHRGCSQSSRPDDDLLHHN